MIALTLFCLPSLAAVRVYDLELLDPVLHRLGAVFGVSTSTRNATGPTYSGLSLRREFAIMSASLTVTLLSMVCLRMGTRGTGIFENDDTMNRP
jgi:hypothetical protein